MPPGKLIAVVLVLRPTLDEIWLRQLGEVARDDGDEQTWLLLSYLQLDTECCLRWSTAPAKYARAENETGHDAREAPERFLVGIGLGAA